MSERNGAGNEAFRPEFTAEAEAVLDVADMAMSAFSYRQTNRLPVSRDSLLYGGRTRVPREVLAPFAAIRRPFSAWEEIVLVSGPEGLPRGKRELRHAAPVPPLKMVLNGDYSRPLAFIYPDPKEGLSIVQVDTDGILVANNLEHVAGIKKWLDGIALHNKLEATHRSRSRLGKLIAGIGTASLLLTGGLLLENNEKTPPSVPPPEQISPPPPVPPPAPEPPAGSEPPGPEVFLRTGRIEKGGMVLEPERSRGVDCIKSYEPPAGFPVNFGELRPPLNLDVDSFLERTGRLFTGEKKQIMYFGEESGDQVPGSPELSDGYAIEYDPENNRYLVYRFSIKERAPRPSDPPLPGVYGDMYGRPLQQVSREELQRGVTFSDGFKTFTARIQDSSAGSSPLRLTIRCDQAQ